MFMTAEAEVTNAVISRITLKISSYSTYLLHPRFLSKEEEEEEPRIERNLFLLTGLSARERPFGKKNLYFVFIHTPH